VFKATPNGFSFSVSRITTSPTVINYALTVFDPSIAFLGPATYDWTFTRHDGSQVLATGDSVQYEARSDEPFTLSVTRTRGPIVDTLTMRERGNDMDRNSGAQFVKHLPVSPNSTATGFDAIVDRSFVDTGLGVLSQGNVAGGATSSIAHRWTTPSGNGVKPETLWAVAFGDPGASNPGEFDWTYLGVTYYEACIWESVADHVNFANCNGIPGGRSVEILPQYLLVDLNDPYLPFFLSSSFTNAYLAGIDLPDAWTLAQGREYLFGVRAAADSVFNGSWYIMSSGMGARTSPDMTDRLSGGLSLGGSSYFVEGFPSARAAYKLEATRLP
jgi:hypothetical protein